MPTPQTSTATGLSFPATPANNRILLDAIKRANLETSANALGIDCDEMIAGNLVHTDPAYSRFDQYADDEGDDRCNRQFKGETRVQQIARRERRAAA